MTSMPEAIEKPAPGSSSDASDASPHKDDAAPEVEKSSKAMGLDTAKLEQPDITPESEEKQPKSLKFKLTIFFLCVLSVVIAIDAVIVGACLAAIAVDLDSTSTESFWVGTSFLLAQTITIPIYGTASEIFGRKWPILNAILIFTFGSILCATAETITWLIAARVVKGVGAGGVMQLAQVIMSDITTLSERGLYMALVSLAWAFGTNIGIPIGGAIATYTIWRWIFWINVPLFVPAWIGLFFCLRLQQDVSSFIKKLGRIDWLGLVLFTAASTLFLYGLTAGGVSAPWDSAQVLAPLIIGFCIYPVFIVVQWKVSPNPMTPLRVFNDRSAVTGYTTSFLHGLTTWCLAYYFIIFFLGALQHSILHASLESMTTMAFIAPAAVVASALIRRTGKFKYLIVVGWILMAAGMASNVTMEPDSSKAVLYAPRCIAGIAAGMLFVTPLFGVQVGQRGDDIGIATSIQIFFRSLGTTFGVGLGGVIFQNELDKHVASAIREGRLPAEARMPNELAEIAYELIRGFPEPIQRVYRGVYADSMDAIWWVLMALAIIGLAISLTSRNDLVRGGLGGKQNFKEDRPGASASQKV